MLVAVEYRSYLSLYRQTQLRSSAKLHINSIILGVQSIHEGFEILL